MSRRPLVSHLRTFHFRAPVSARSGLAGWATIAALGVGMALAGCVDTAGVEVGDDQELVPASATTLFDQAGICDQIFKRHAAIRDADLTDGVLRWGCGDVPGVTQDDLGQEYCEYKPVSGGKIVKTAADLKPGAKLSCVFTSVYQDVKGYGTAETPKYIGELAKALTTKENLNAASVDAAAVGMAVGFNSRGAATALIVDCAKNANKAPLDEPRQAACYEAFAKGGANASKLKTACRGKVLTDKTKWAAVEKLGAKVAKPGDANYEWQRDVAACLRTKAAKGITWRNSDPMICTRVTRAVNECAVQYNPIPNTVDGFTFTGWTNRALPQGCRFAKVKAADYPNLVICEASVGEIDDLPTNMAWSSNLNQFCHDRFSNDLVMMAPLRALQKTGKADGGFCSTYQGGWKP